MFIFTVLDSKQKKDLTVKYMYTFLPSFSLGRPPTFPTGPSAPGREGGSGRGWSSRKKDINVVVTRINVVPRYTIFAK